MICTYCGKDIKDLDNLKTLEYEEDKVLVCSDKCANDFRKHKKISERNRIKFLGLTILNSVIAIILYIIGLFFNDILDVIATFYIFETIGVVSLKYPHVSISKVKNYGMTNGTKVVKKRGIILLVLGFLLSIGMFFFIREFKFI